MRRNLMSNVHVFVAYDMPAVVKKGKLGGRDFQ